MRITLVTGGARSGKSRFAAQLAREQAGDDVVFMATGIITDEEMRRRIELHRAERPPAWRTLETPRGAASALAAARSRVVLLDCLTLLISNTMLDVMEQGMAAAEQAVATEIDDLVRASASGSGRLIVVTNEVGMGVVPASEQGRLFRDLVGRANQRIAGVADDVFLIASGLPLRLKGE